MIFADLQHQIPRCSDSWFSSLTEASWGWLGTRTQRTLAGEPLSFAWPQLVVLATCSHGGWIWGASEQSLESALHPWCVPLSLQTSSRHPWLPRIVTKQTLGLEGRQEVAPGKLRYWQDTSFEKATKHQKKCFLLLQQNSSESSLMYLAHIWTKITKRSDTVKFKTPRVYVEQVGRAGGRLVDLLPATPCSACTFPVKQNQRFKVF